MKKRAEPVAFAGGDPNFYDRFFFNGYSQDGEVFFAAALGVYPHLNIMDGAVSILKDGVQRCVYVSRILGMERMDTHVGPLSVEVIEPFKQIHLELDDAQGLALDVRFEGRHFPIEEPRFTYRQGPRMLMDCTRMTQNGRWTGSLAIDGESLEVSDFYGTRDRSWGVRPIGGQDPRPVVPVEVPQFFWLWAPINFPDHAHFFHVNEDEQGAAWNTRSMLAREGALHDCLDHLTGPRLSIDWVPGTRRVAAAGLNVLDRKGREHVITYKPGQVFQMKGIGYGHPRWRHGAFQGGYAIEREDFTPSELAWNDPENLHIQAIVETRHEIDGAHQADGIGALEQLFLGPHAGQGWMNILDA